MTTPYHSLPHALLGKHGRLARPAFTALGSVTFEDPATAVMTDLRAVQSHSIERGASIDAANRKMIACGIRLLFVLDREGDIDGLITATDILGEKPIRHLQERGGTYGEILVDDIMTPAAELEVLRLTDVERASVGDLVETMKSRGRQHALVAESDSKGVDVVCGIFSTTRIYRQLGEQPEPVSPPQSFSEVEGRLVSGY